MRGQLWLWKSGYSKRRGSAFAGARWDGLVRSLRPFSSPRHGLLTREQAPMFFLCLNISSPLSPARPQQRAPRAEQPSGVTLSHCAMIDASDTMLKMRMTTSSLRACQGDQR